MNALRLFGTLELDVDGRRLGPRDLGGNKPKQVLEILATERGRVVAKDRLADLLWGETLPRNVSATLETYVSVLRRHLGSSGRAMVVTEPGGYRIEVGRVEVDLDRFDALSSRSDLEGLEEAISLVRGEVLADEPYAIWAVQLRDAYAERLIRVLVSAAERRLEEGDPAAASEHAETAIGRDPVREAAHRVLMRAYHVLGRRDEALRAYERCRRALVEELGVDPSAETIELHALILRGEVSSPAASEPRVTRPRAGDHPLLGRGDELVELKRAVGTALAGAPSILLVEGEAGIGKSRLLDEVCAHLSEGRIGRAKCFELDRDLPYVPLAVALRDLLDDDPDISRFPELGEILPELGGLDLPPEAARARALESLVRLLAAVAPTVLVLDDLQWADASTLAALSYLRRRAGSAPLVILGAFRTEDVGLDHPLRTMVVDQNLILGPLSAEDLRPLGAPWLYERTGGHPLFCVECLRAAEGEGGEEIPKTLREVILSRCRSAGAPAHRVLAVASVLGRAFGPAVLARMLDEEEVAVVEVLEGLCDRLLLRVVGEGFDFRHDLIRETLASSLSLARRKLLHGRALEALEATGAEPGEMAVHAEGSGALQQALRYAVRAGEGARGRWANVEAAAHLERAVRLADEHPDLLEPEALESILVRLARVLFTIGRAAEAMDVASRACASAERREDDRARFDALEALTIVAHRGLSAPSQALVHGRAAADLAERVGDAELRARAHTIVGAPCASIGRLDEAMDHFRAALSLVEETGAPAPAWTQARIGHVLHYRAQEEDAIAWCERAEAAALEEHDEETLLFGRWIRSLALSALGRYRESWQVLESAAEVGKGEEVFWHARFPNTFGSILADCCLWERALERDVASLEIAGPAAAPPIQEVRMQSLLNIATDQLGLGEVAGARRTVEQVRAAIDEVEYARFRWLNRLHYVDAEVCLIEGEQDAALEAAERCLAMASEYRQPKYEVRGRIAAARALGRAGATERAMRHARAAGDLADRLGLVAWSWRAWRTAAQLGGAASDAARARKTVLAAAGGLDEDLRAEFLRAVPVDA